MLFPHHQEHFGFPEVLGPGNVNKFKEKTKKIKIPARFFQSFPVFRDLNFFNSILSI
jgi:hypothetical protein